jgi:hypothetical protein
MQAAMLVALAQLLLGRAQIGEANRAWLQRRSEAGDWIEGDELQVLEMLPATLRSVLDRTRD